jgi:hypothetical protein
MTYRQFVGCWEKRAHPWSTGNRRDLALAAASFFDPVAQPALPTARHGHSGVPTAGVTASRWHPLCSRRFSCGRGGAGLCLHRASKEGS